MTEHDLPENVQRDLAFIAAWIICFVLVVIFDKPNVLAIVGVLILIRALMVAYWLWKEWQS